MTEFVSLVLTFSVVFLIFKLVFEWRRRRPPPGPWGLPLLGHLPFLGDNPLVPLMNWYKTYGNIYSIQMGKWKTVVLSGSAIKRALTSKGDEFSGRPDFLSFQKIGDHRSIVSGDFCPRYVLQRKIANNVLRMFTAVRGSNPIDDLVLGETNNLVEDFFSNGNNDFNPMEILRLSVANIIYQVCYGRGLSIKDDADFAYLIKNVDDFNHFFKAGNAVDVLPWLRFFLRKDIASFYKIIETSDEIRMKKIREHEETFDAENIRDCADGVIAATRQYSDDLKAEVGLEDRDIHIVLADFTGAGFDTTTATMCWIVYFVAKYRGIQAEIRAEIENVVGDRSPTVKDKDNLPLTEATILESLRVGNVAALGVPHKTTRDINFMGYDIAEGTVVMVNYQSINFDPEIWSEPKCFNPKRFLDETGKLDQSKVDQLVSFGLGRRTCPGENLARLEIFLYFTNIIQKCYLELAPGEHTDNPGEFVLVYRPLPFRIRVRSVH